MRTLLLTGYDEAFAPLGDLTTPLMHEYADRHSLAFWCARTYLPQSHPSWQKMGLIRRQLLGKYERVIWLDADTVITNMDAKPWKNLTEGLCVSRDWGTDAGPDDFSMGNFVACRDSIPLWGAAERFAGEWANKPLWEQSAMRQLYATSHEARELIHIYPRRLLNPVPVEVDASVVEPWQTGDWLCHLTMLALNERVRLFHQLTEREAVAA